MKLKRGRRDREAEIRDVLFRMPVSKDVMRVQRFITWVNDHHDLYVRQHMKMDGVRLERIKFLNMAVRSLKIRNKLMREAFLRSAGRVFLRELAEIKGLYAQGEIDFPKSYNVDAAARLAMFRVFDLIRHASGIDIEKAFEKARRESEESS